MTTETPHAGRCTPARAATCSHSGSSPCWWAWCCFCSVWCSLILLANLLLDQWEGDPLVYTLYYPLALWTVLGFFAVVRFLGYLDLRIRREGWEVELMMRAEGARLERQLA